MGNAHDSGYFSYRHLLVQIKFEHFFYIDIKPGPAAGGLPKGSFGGRALDQKRLLSLQGLK